MKANVFHPKQLFITGQQRTDVIPELKKRSTHDKGNILIATQPIPDRLQMRKYVRDTLESLSSAHCDSTIVIRPHPSEKDQSYIQECISTFPDLDIQVDGRTDLFIALAQSGLVLTAYSTVGIEALYFELPVIIYDYLREDLLGLCDAGVAFGAHEANGLQQLLNMYTSDDLKIDREKVSAYVSQAAFAVDGVVYERMDMAIEKVLQSD